MGTDGKAWNDLAAIVCGSREGAPVTSGWAWVARSLDAFEARHARIRHVVHGGAKGVDTSAGDWAKVRVRPCTVVPADWERDKRSAGPKRNAEMLKLLQCLGTASQRIVLAFPGGDGTENMVTLAREAGELVWRCSLVGKNDCQWTEAP